MTCVNLLMVKMTEIAGKLFKINVYIEIVFYWYKNALDPNVEKIIIFYTCL